MHIIPIGNTEEYFSDAHYLKVVLLLVTVQIVLMNQFKQHNILSFCIIYALLPQESLVCRYLLHHSNKTDWISTVKECRIGALSKNLLLSYMYSDILISKMFTLKSFFRLFYLISRKKFTLVLSPPFP